MASCHTSGVTATRWDVRRRVAVESVACIMVYCTRMSFHARHLVVSVGPRARLGGTNRCRRDGLPVEAPSLGSRRSSSNYQLPLSPSDRITFDKRDAAFFQLESTACCAAIESPASIACTITLCSATDVAISSIRLVIYSRT